VDRMDSALTREPPDVRSEQLTFETAAGHATARVPIAAPLQRVGEVRDRLAGHRYESASHLVVCERDKFLGIMTIEDLLSAPAGATIESLMDREPPIVAPGVDQEVAAWRAVHHEESALAVVDRAGRFVGLIPPHRLVAVLLSEHEEDLSHIAGFLRDASMARATSEEPVPRRFRHRVPWLLLGLAGALFAADLVAMFENQLRVNVMVAFFMPGIVYLADAVGTQTETVVVRGLSVGISMRRMVGRELLAGLLIGIALAAVALPVVWLRWSDASLAQAVALSVLMASSTATLVAMTLPWLFDAFAMDPAFGSGSLGTVIQDLLSIWIYLSVTSFVMS
jgi:magnesium transporter